MAHNDFIRPAGDWSLDPEPTESEFGDFDAAQKKAINGDDGGVWAPSDPIIIGGDGLQVPGPFDADDADIIIPSGKKITVNGAMDANAASNVNIKSGSNVNIESGGAIKAEAGSTIQLQGTVLPTFDAPRFYTRRGTRLLSTTFAGSVGTSIVGSPTNPDFWSSTYPNGQGTIVVAKKLTTIANEHASLEIPGAQGMLGATLVLVRLRTFGLDSNTPTTYPTYECFRRSDAVTASLQSGGPVNDGHNLPATWFNNPIATDIVPDQNAVIDPATYEYTIKVTPASVASTGTQLAIQSVLAVYSVPGLNR